MLYARHSLRFPETDQFSRVIWPDCEGIETGPLSILNIVDKEKQHPGLSKYRLAPALFDSTKGSMTQSLSVQTSFQRFCPITEAVERFASKSGVEERGQWH